MAIVILAAQVPKMKKNDVLKAQETELEEQLAEEEARAEELDELEKYVGSEEYVKDVAKDKLGMAEGNEIIIRPEQ